MSCSRRFMSPVMILESTISRERRRWRLRLQSRAAPNNTRTPTQTPRIALRTHWFSSISSAELIQRGNHSEGYLINRDSTVSPFTSSLTNQASPSLQCYTAITHAIPGHGFDSFEITVGIWFCSESIRVGQLSLLVCTIMQAAIGQRNCYNDLHWQKLTTQLQSLVYY